MRLAKILSCSLIAIWCVATPTATQAPQTTARPVVFEGARLITGDGSAPIEDSVFLVENGEFTRVGRKGELQAPAGAARVDLTGKTVTPAWIDAHTHVGYEKYSNVGPIWARIDPVGRGVFNYGSHNFTRENILDHMYRFAYFGVAAAWSAGYEFGEVAYEIRDEILAGKHPNAARYYPGGPGFTTPEAVLPGAVRQSAYGIANEEDVRYAVRKQAARKVGLIKLWNEKMTPALYGALIDEAHKHDMRVGVHPVALSDSKGLLRAGLDVFLHMVQPDDEFIALVKERRPYTMLNSSTSRENFYAPHYNPPHPLLVETLAPFHLKDLAQRLANVDPAVAEKSKTSWNNTVTTAKRLRDAGARFAIGADAGGAARNRPIGWTVMLELENMVAAGFTPAEAIVSATKTSAEMLRLDDLGTVAPGKEAAFVVLDANPLDDITNTRRINKVYLRGQEVDRAGLRAAWAKSWSGSSN